MTTSPHLPIELYAEILNGLHHYRDRTTLVSAALVSTEWRKQSQRILFSRMTDNYYGNEWEAHKDNLVSRHMGFLQTIAEHPGRFGPLVHSYSQSGLAFNPAERRNPERLPKSGSDLWQLLGRALPAMINLKHLKLSPLYDSRPVKDNYVSRSALLRSFGFQLETLAWAFIYDPDNGLLEFLRTQKNITHLESAPSIHNTLTWLEDRVCPHLVSVAGSFNSLNHIARSRKIIAWKWARNIREELGAQDSLVLPRLSYLSLPNYRELREIIGTIDLNITLLEITNGTFGIGNPPSLSNMPMLRVLVLIQNIHINANSEEITEIAIASFRQLPSLEYIIQRDPNGYEYRYLKLTLSPNPVVGILREELMVDYNSGAPWWRVYNV